MKEEIFIMKDREKGKQQYIEELKRFINQKQNDIYLSTSLLKMKKETLLKKQEKLENEKKIYERYYFRKRALRLKKNAEFAYVFFNKACSQLYIIPLGFDVLTRGSNEEKQKFYEKNSLRLSVMLGGVAVMVNQLAKMYGVPLKNPLFINGSKSYVLSGKKDFLALFYYTKYGDINTSFDLAINLLHSNLNQLLLYFNVSDYKELKLFNFFTIFLKFYEFFQGCFTKNSFEFVKSKELKR